GLRAEFHVDGFALDLVGPFEVRAMTLRRIPVAGAVGLAALHHSLQDGALQEIPQLVEFLTSLAEAWVGGAGKDRSGCFARGHDTASHGFYPTVLIQYDKNYTDSLLKAVTSAPLPSS